MGREIPVARAKKPLWEASAARKSAEALMQTLKKRQRSLAVTLILNLVMLLGVIYLALAPVYHLLLSRNLPVPVGFVRRHAGQWLFGAVPRPPEQ